LADKSSSKQTCIRITLCPYQSVISSHLKSAIELVVRDGFEQNRVRVSEGDRSGF